MGQSDLEALLEMGFEKTRAELAVKKSGGLQGALNWLEENQDKPLDELQAAAQDDDDENMADAGGGPAPNIAAAKEGDEEAKSFVCDECSKKFRNKEEVTFHATKSGHENFSLSTEEIAPLTAEERKARLEELRQKVLEKRALQAVQDKEEAKKNDKIRMKATKESQDIKEDLQRKEQIKEAAKKRQEKLDELEAKKRIKARIEADKAERRRKAEEAKAARNGGGNTATTTATTTSSSPSLAGGAAAAAAPPAKPSSAYTEARLRLQAAGGNLQKTYPAETTLLEVAQQIEAETGAPVSSFTMTFPRKVFEKSNGMDFGQTLKEAGLVPSAVLIVK